MTEPLWVTRGSDRKRRSRTLESKDRASRSVEQEQPGIGGVQPQEMIFGGLWLLS